MRLAKFLRNDYVKLDDVTVLEQHHLMKRNFLVHMNPPLQRFFELEKGIEQSNLFRPTPANEKFQVIFRKIETNFGACNRFFATSYHT